MSGALAALCVVSACTGSLDGDSESSDPGSANVGGSTASGGAPGMGSGTGGSSSAGRPAEEENESRYLAPVATGDFLWTANPLSGRVAIIDVRTLQVRLETAGDGPTQVAPLPLLEGEYGTLVMNERSDDATLFRVDAAGRISKRTGLRTHAEANAWSVSSSGLWAVAWTDAKLRRAVDALETFQDITLLSLAPGAEKVFPLSIGARPSALVYSEDETHAYAVTDEGISVIRLGEIPEVVRLIAVSDDPLASPAGRDLSFAPDASYAVVRTDGQSEIAVVELPAGEREVLKLGGIVTDVDLAPDGQRAFAVLAEAAEVVEIPLPAQGLDPADFARVKLPNETIGAIALNADASAAVVYSTVLGTTRVSLLDTRAGGSAPRGYDLIAPLSAVFASPDPRFAVAFQRPAVGSQKAGAFSLLPLAAPRAPKIVATDAEPAQIAFSPEGDSALVTVRNDATQEFGAYVVDLTTQQTDFIALASPPLAAGVVAAARRAYIAQAHPEGRITFISLEDGSVQTLNAFELAARIVSD